MELKNILKELKIKGVDTQISYDIEEEMFVLDLNTQAKSHLHLYENGILKGRYGYQTDMNILNTDSLIIDLCHEFVGAVHGKEFGNRQWFSLCDKFKIKY